MHPDSPAGRWVVVGPGETLELHRPPRRRPGRGHPGGQRPRAGRRDQAGAHCLFVLAPRARRPRRRRTSGPCRPPIRRRPAGRCAGRSRVGSSVGSRSARATGGATRASICPRRRGTPVSRGRRRRGRLRGRRRPRLRQHGRPAPRRRSADRLRPRRRPARVARGSPCGPAIGSRSWARAGTPPGRTCISRSGPVEIPRDPMPFFPRLPR